MLPVPLATGLLPLSVLPLASAALLKLTARNGAPPATVEIALLSCPTFTASVLPVPAATLTMRRSLPTAPTETVLA